MTRVTEVRHLETCLDSTVVKEIVLDRPLTEACMRRMAEEARLQYFPHFPRPYFRIDRRRTWMLQGAVGNTTFRATFLPGAGDDAAERLRRLVEEDGAADSTEARGDGGAGRP